MRTLQRARDLSALPFSGEQGSSAGACYKISVHARFEELEPESAILVAVGQLEHVAGQHVLWLNALPVAMAALGRQRDRPNRNILLGLFNLGDMCIVQLLFLERLKRLVVLVEEKVDVGDRS